MAETKELKFRLLDADEIECRVGQQGTSSRGTWCSVLLYKDARCDMMRLDEVFGTEGWQRHHHLLGNYMVCTISAYDSKTKQWIEKEDVGTPAKTEPEKSVFSDSFKRAATNMGIGRELYTGPRVFIMLGQGDMNGQKIKTTFHVGKIGYSENRKINELVILDNKNNVRYTYGITQQQYLDWLSKQQQSVEETPQPKEPVPAAQPTTGDSAKDSQLSQAIAQIDKAKTVKQLVTIWGAFPDLQSEHDFTSRMTQKRVELTQKKSA